MKSSHLYRSFFSLGISKVILLVSLFVLIGCGYKPSVQYIKNVVDGSVYVNVIVDPQEPENAVYVKDALHQMVLKRFKGSIASKEEAENIITASYMGTTFNPISYSNGYITRYRADVKMNFVMKTKKGVYRRSIRGYVEEDIQESSKLSSSLRTEAIRTGMTKALDQFLAYVSTQGVIVEEIRKEKEAKKNGASEK